MNDRARKMVASPRVFATLGGLALLVLGGCGSSQEVSGKATYNGEPVANGVITFVPADRVGATAGAQIVAGHYYLEDISPGAKIVHIEGFREIPILLSSEEEGELAEQRLRGGNARPTDAELATVIPDNAVGNRATVTIEPGGQEFDFHLTTPQ